MNVIKLDPPFFPSNKSLTAILKNRRSVRTYREKLLLRREISSLLWAAAGQNCDWGGRTYPSAGATYPMKVYLLVLKAENLSSGLFEYDEKNHALKLLNQDNIVAGVTTAALNQKMISEAPATVIFSADFSKTTARYGEQRGKRYVYMEAGHCGQNLHIAAESLDIGTVMIGAFNDSELKKALGLKEDILYLCPVGKKNE